MELDKAKFESISKIATLKMAKNTHLFLYHADFQGLLQILVIFLHLSHLIMQDV